MAQSAQSREEPSMEDILSSIRRIIQSNDETEGGNEAPADPAPASSNEHALPSMAEIAEASVASTEEVSAPVVEAPVVNTQAKSEVPEPEVAETPAAPEVPEVKAPMDMSAIQAQVAAKQAQQTSEKPTEGTLTEAPARASQAEQNSAPEPEAAASVPSQSKPSTEVVQQDSGPASTNERSSSALISAGPEAQVVASFAQLSDAVEAQTNKSLDEMAGDMLKPMLQEWLDNNLPGLVERLVREEIERVARGGGE